MSRTTALLELRGDDTEPVPVFAGEGAQRQDGWLKVYRCNECQREVVWATSKRTGKKYLVNVTTGRKDQRFYMKQWVHKCGEEEKGMGL